MLPKPPNGYLPKDRAETLIRQFVMGAEMDAPTLLPKRADPVQADHFLQKLLDDPDKLKNRHVARAGELMRFFDLRGRAPQVAKLLDKQERELPQFFRSLTAMAIVADMGDAPAQAEAVKYHQYLAAHRLAEGNYDGLVDTFFHLPTDAKPNIITDPINARMNVLKPKIDSDTDAASAYYKLEDMINDRLPTVQKAKARRHEIEDLKSDARRRQELIRFYLRAERNAYVDLRLWAVMMLQRDCSANTPPELAKEFEHMFQIVMDQTSRRGALTADDEADVKKYTTSCARGVLFYGGDLDEKESEFADKYKARNQNDELYWEPEKTADEQAGQ